MPVQTTRIKDPGSFGLNSQVAQGLDDPRWALGLSNAFFDEIGRIVSRKGFEMLTDTGGHDDDVETVHIYLSNVDDSVSTADTSEVISSTANNLYASSTTTTKYDTLTDVTGAVAPTNGNWQFVNFNGKCIGVQKGETPIVRTTGNFAAIVASSGTLPDGNHVLSAWGRLWVSQDDNQTIQWCDTLDETDWGSGTAGSIILTEIWPDGIDKIVALAEWENQLVIFGSKSVLIYAGAESDPTNNLALADVIPRAGCVARDTVQPVGTDILYLSDRGVRALSRGLRFSTLPLAEVSRNVEDEIKSRVRELISSGDTVDISGSNVRAAYSPAERMYVLKLGALYYAFDVANRLPDGSLKAAQWTGIGFRGIATDTDGTFILGQEGVAASSTTGIGQYAEYQDNGSGYTMVFTTIWNDFGNHSIKIPKAIHQTLESGAQTSVALSWAYDYGGAVSSQTRETIAAATAAEWGSAEWSEDEWGGGAFIDRLKFNLSGSGEYISVSMSIPVDGGKVSLGASDWRYIQGRIGD